MGSLDSFNPATGELLGSVQTIEPGDVQAAVAEVAEVQPFWGELSLPDRGRYLRRTAEILAGDVEEVDAPADERAGQADHRGPHDGGGADGGRSALDRR